jgi:hypothetical protein
VVSLLAKPVSRTELAGRFCRRKPFGRNELERRGA